jgi:hypothetical protein
MLRLQLAGADTLLVSSLCTACPHSAAGCCAAPPRVALSDIARIVAHGGRDWLLEEIGAGRLVAAPGNLWLVLPRTTRTMPGSATPLAACVYLGETGCTIPHDRRSATCNYYVCEDALVAGGDAEPQARAVLDDLVATFTRRDADLAAATAASWPNGHTFDAPFLDWLGARALPAG